MTAGNDSHGDLQTYRYALTISDGPRSTHEDSLTRHRSLASAQPSQMTHSVRFGSLCSKASAVEAAISHDGASRSMRSALTSVGREKDEEGARASAAPSSVARKSSRGEGAIAMVRGSKRRALRIHLWLRVVQHLIQCLWLLDNHAGRVWRQRRRSHRPRRQSSRASRSGASGSGPPQPQPKWSQHVASDLLRPHPPSMLRRRLLGVSARCAP